MFSLFKQRAQKKWLLLSLLMVGLPLTANAGFITINESALESIFSQPIFGTRSIDVRINPFQSIVNDQFLSIDNAAEISSETNNGQIDSLFELSQNLNLSTSSSIAMFFVDSINDCGGTGNNIVGCAQYSGYTINNVANTSESFAFIDSTYATTSTLNSSGIDLGSYVIAHELGHVFGLSGHVGDNSARDNLMNPVVDANTVITLTSTQVDTLFDPAVNSLIQGNESTGFFIEISPIAITSASAVPEPSTYAMLGLGLLLIGFHRKRKKSPTNMTY